MTKFKKGDRVALKKFPEIVGTYEESVFLKGDTKPSFATVKWDRKGADTVISYYISPEELIPFAPLSEDERAKRVLNSFIAAANYLLMNAKDDNLHHMGGALSDIVDTIYQIYKFEHFKEAYIKKAKRALNVEVSD